MLTEESKNKKISLIENISNEGSALLRKVGLDRMIANIPNDQLVKLIKLLTHPLARVSLRQAIDGKSPIYKEFIDVMEDIHQAIEDKEKGREFFNNEITKGAIGEQKEFAMHKVFGVLNDFPKDLQDQFLERLYDLEPDVLLAVLKCISNDTKVIQMVANYTPQMWGKFLNKLIIPNMPKTTIITWEDITKAYKTISLEICSQIQGRTDDLHDKINAIQIENDALKAKHERENPPGIFMKLIKFLSKP